MLIDPWSKLAEVLQASAAVRRLRALRRREAVERLVAEGWSRESAEEWLRCKDGPICAFLESQDSRNTKRVATGGRLAARPSGRRRRKDVRRPRTPLW